MATPEIAVPTLSPKELTEQEEALKEIGSDYAERFGFHDPETGYAYKAPKGLSEQVVRDISEYKSEPEWMREFRLKALQQFQSRPTPTWGGNLGQIDFDDIHYFVRASEKAGRSWDEVPEDIVREHWATVIPPNDNKLAALNSAVWSGSSFVYVPAGVKVEMPLQAYFRTNTENMGQFERTLIVAEEGADVHYIEGCTAPVYSTDSLHSAVVEIVVKPGANVRYTTDQNCSHTAYNLVTKRAMAQEHATMEWVDCNLGSRLTMKYPAIWLLGERAHGEV